jgi:hypothetical protein
MRRFNAPLEGIRVAAKCSADWEQMVGDERLRFCGKCSLHVYNLSSMTRNEAESLIARHEGKLCVRYYQRSDGSVITQNCPVGLRAIRRRWARVSKAVASATLGFLTGLGVFRFTSVSLDVPMGELKTYSTPLSMGQIAYQDPAWADPVPQVTTGTFMYVEPTQVERRAKRRTSRARKEATR